MQISTSAKMCPVVILNQFLSKFYYFFFIHQSQWVQKETISAMSDICCVKQQNLNEPFFLTSQMNKRRQSRLHFPHFCCCPFHVVLCSPLIKGWLPLEDISRLHAASSQCDDKPQRNAPRSWKLRGPRREAGPSNKATLVYSFVFYSSHYLPLALPNCFPPLPSCLLYFFL